MVPSRAATTPGSGQVIPEADLNRIAPLSTTDSLLTLRIPGKRGLEAGIQLPEAGQCGPAYHRDWQRVAKQARAGAKGSGNLLFPLLGSAAHKSETANICEERHEWRLELAQCPARVPGLHAGRKLPQRWPGQIPEAIWSYPHPHHSHLTSQKAGII